MVGSQTEIIQENQDNNSKSESGLLWKLYEMLPNMEPEKPKQIRFKKRTPKSKKEGEVNDGPKGSQNQGNTDDSRAGLGSIQVSVVPNSPHTFSAITQPQQGISENNSGECQSKQDVPTIEDSKSDKNTDESSPSSPHFIYNRPEWALHYSNKDIEEMLTEINMVQKCIMDALAFNSTHPEKPFAIPAHLSKASQCAYFSASTIGCMLGYSEVRNLANVIKDIGKIYHGIYIGLRLMVGSLRAINEGPLLGIVGSRFKDTISRSIDFSKPSWVEENLNLHFSSVVSQLVYLMLTKFILIEHEKDVTQIFDQITNLFAQLKFRQQLVRRGLPLDTVWPDAYSTSEMQNVRHSMVKLLRMAALMKYIMQYHMLSTGMSTVTSENSDRDAMLTASLMGEDTREIDAILSYLKLSPDQFSKTRENWPIAVLETKPFGFKSDLLLDKYNRDLRFTFQYIPDNFLTFYKENFYSECFRCNKKGLIAVCLLCGRHLCIGFCSNIGPTMMNGQMSNHELTVVGNAAKHSFEYHNGICAFITCFDGTMVIYEDLRIYLYSMFKNSLGTEISAEIAYAHFDDFTINKSRFNELHKALSELKVKEQIVLDGLKFGEFFNRAIF